MRAIVMAGGEGTRLRPLTEGRPKPMVELLGKSVLRRTVEHLKKYGITDICFTLRYLPGVIMDEFGDGGELGVNIEHRVEKEPLGTAGSVRACLDFTKGEDVLIISGDAVCDFDLRSIIRFHREKGAEATIALYEHPEPTAFGLVLTDRDGRVTGFSEKPTWDRVLTDRVNTGIYVLSRGVLELIPESAEYDFGRDLFPRLLREGRGLWAVPAKGYWCDIGSPEAYLRCCMDLLEGRADIDLAAPELSPGVRSWLPLQDVRVTPPVYVGKDCAVSPGAVIGPGAVLGDGTTVGPGSRIVHSAVNGASVGAKCAVDGAVIGRGAALENASEVGPGCVVGDRARVAAGAVLMPGVRLWSEREAPAGRVLRTSVTAEAPRERLAFSDSRSIRAPLGGAMTPESAMELGRFLGKGGRVGTSHHGGEGARLLSDAVACGVSASGGECSRLDCDFEAQLAGSMDVFALNFAVFVREEGRELTLTVLGEHGLPLPPDKRRRLEAALSAGEAAVAERVGPVTPITGAARAYISGVIEDVHALTGALRMRGSAAVTGTGAENRALRCVLAGLGLEIREKGPDVPSFNVLTGGFELNLKDERGRNIDSLHALALAAQAAMRLGLPALAVSERLPAAVTRLSARYGCALSKAQDETMLRQRYLSDAVLGAALIAAASSGSGASVSRLFDDLPPFETAERRVRTDCSRARAMELLSVSRAEFAADITSGLRLSDRRGTLRVAPDFDGKSLLLRAESATREDASSLLDEYERAAREALKGST